MKTVYTNTESIFEIACKLREFGDNGDITWQEWYAWNIGRTHMTSNEIEAAVAKHFNIPQPASHGFVSIVCNGSVTFYDLEEKNICDMNDADDEHLHELVREFRKWMEQYTNQHQQHVIGTDEAATLWGLSQSYIKLLCQQGKLQARMIGKQWILNRHQPNPKNVGRL